jgi:glyoxylase-like metal-dependent hydrolase (beta-lactamase superfamily II)
MASRILAVAGPAALGLLTALYVGRPSTYFLASGVALIVAILACDAWIIARRQWVTGTLALFSQIALLTFVGTYAASPLPAPSPLSDSLPRASPPDGMSIHSLPTGVNHRTAAFAYRGGSPWDKRDSVSTAVLVRHPRGDVLIDTGIGRTIAQQMRAFPFLFRLGTELERLRPAADQLDSTGYDRRQLRYILLTHAHWDHVSGVPDFPGVPVLITGPERRFMDEGSWATADAKSMKANFQEYAFDGGPYLGFTQSHDLYGDGSIVIVPTPGHTPGSVAVFVTLSEGTRYAFVGDLVWQLEGLLEREERPWFEARTLAEDSEHLRQSLLRMHAIVTRFPQITMVPSHDPRGYASIRQWPPSADRVPR